MSHSTPTTATTATPGGDPAPVAHQPLPKAVLLELSRKNDWLAAGLLLLRAGFHTGLAAIALQLLHRGHIVVGLLVLLPHCAAMSFLGWAGIGHELFHQSVFSVRWLNRFLFRLFSVLTWSNYGYFQVTHPTHHAHTLAADDPEAAPGAVLTSWQVVWLCSVDLPGLWRRLRVLTQNAGGRVPARGAAGVDRFAVGSVARVRLIHGARVVLACQAALLLWFIWLGEFWLILIVNLAPFCLAIVNRTLAAAQHHGLQPGEAHYCYASTRTVRLHPVLAFFYANMNYHVEHHFYPAVPFYRLVALHRVMQAQRACTHLCNGYPATLRLLAREGLFGPRLSAQRASAE